MKAIVQTRRLLEAQAIKQDNMQATFPPDPVFDPTNGSSTSTARKPFKPNPPFDTSMTLTILVLLTALFFMGFFSLYIRRLSGEGSAEVRRRRHQSPPLREAGNHRKGLDPASVKALPLIAYGAPAKRGMTEGCTICLSEFEEGEIVKLIPHCAHVFHPTCIDTWIASHVSCPLCRSTQLFKKFDGEVRLGVTLDKNDNGASVLGARSTADGGDTCREVESSESGVRRSCSCSSLEAHVALHRSPSF